MHFETLETERLILRKLSPTEYNFIFENYSKDQIKKFLGNNSEEEYTRAKRRYEEGYTTYNRSLLFFQLLDKSTKKVIGNCGFHNWYIDHKRAELGYAITDNDFLNYGLMTEALSTIIDYGFEHMKLHRIEALVGTRNVPSLKLMDKFSFTKEGVLREHYFINDKFEDSAIFSRLHSDK